MSTKKDNIKANNKDLSNDGGGKLQAQDNRPARGRGGKYNFPQCAPPEDAEKVRARLSTVLQWMDRGNAAPVNLSNPIDINQRAEEYIQACVTSGQRPTVESFCLSLGYARQRVWEAECKPGPASDAIKKAKSTIAAFDAAAVTAGELNPVVYIFRGKNFYGLRDQVDVAAVPADPLQAASAQEISTKYGTLLPDE